MEAELEESDYDPDQDSINSFEIVLDTPAGKKPNQSEFTSAESKKEVVEEMARSAINLMTFNGQVPAAYMRTPRTVRINQETPVQFENYLNKAQSTIVDVIQRIKSTLAKQEIDTLQARCSNQVVVARVMTSNKDKANDFIVEIQDDKSEERLDIGDELLWTGLITTMRIEWRFEYYLLKEKIFAPFQDQKPKHVEITNNPRSTKIVIAKGPFSASTSLDYSSLSILTECLKHNQPDVLILMGPFITKHNLGNLTDFSDHTLRNLIIQIQEQLSNTQVIVVPSTQDVCSRYPIPQPALNIKDCGRAFMASNPSILNISADEKSVCRMSLINTDIVMGIEKNLKKKVLKSKELHHQICEAYIKQQMFVTTTHDMLDESNLLGLYNGGNHGDFIIYASEEKIPMVERVGKHLFLGIAHLLKVKEKIGYYTEITVYEGTCNLMDRVRVDVRKISY